MNNILYIATDNNGVIKIGYTNKNADERIAIFSKNYNVNFQKVAEFEIKNESALKIERFVHEFLNAQFLNVKMIYDKFNIVEYESYVKDKNDGYTEIFLCNPVVLTNLITFFHISGFLNVTSKELDDISKIKSFDESTLKTHYQNILRFIGKEGKKDLFGSPNIITKRTNIFEKNFKIWKEKSFSDLELVYKNNIFKLKHNNGFTSISNYIFGNNDLDVCKLLLQKCVLNISKEDMLKFFDENLQKIIKQNENFSPHNRKFSKEDKESIVFKRLEAFKEEKEKIISDLFKNKLIEKIIKNNIQTLTKLEKVLDIPSEQLNNLNYLLDKNKITFKYKIIDRKIDTLFFSVEADSSENLNIYTNYILSNITAYIMNPQLSLSYFLKKDKLITYQIEELKKFHSFDDDIENHTTEEVFNKYLEYKKITKKIDMKNIDLFLNKCSFQNYINTNQRYTIETHALLNIFKSYNKKFVNKKNKFIIDKQNQDMERLYLMNKSNYNNIDCGRYLVNNIKNFRFIEFDDLYSYTVSLLKEPIKYCEKELIQHLFKPTNLEKPFNTNEECDDYLDTVFNGMSIRKHIILKTANGMFELFKNNFNNKYRLNKQFKINLLISRIISNLEGAQCKNYEEIKELEDSLKELESSNYKKYVTENVMDVAKTELLKKKKIFTKQTERLSFNKF